MSEEKKESAKADEKNKKEKSWAEQMAENIAGNNESLKAFILLLTNPVVISGAVIALMYWLFNSSGKKEEMEKLEKENKELKDQLDDLAGQLRELQDKYRSLRSRFFMEEEDEGQPEYPLNGGHDRRRKRENRYENRYNRRSRYRPSYLD